MSGALYGISFVDPVTWINVMITLFSVMALANVVPARRASAVDPFTALRAD